MLQSILGIIVFLLIAWLFSENKKNVNLKRVGIGVLLQLLIGFILLKIPILQKVFLSLNSVVLMIEKATKAGSSFMFGYLSGGPLPFAESSPGASFIVAFQVLPIVLVMSALTAVLFHFGVLQFIVNILSKFLQKSLKISGAQGLGVSANVFLGIVEAPLFIKPYLLSMSRNSLFTVMTAGMATVAGTVMVLYASILSKTIPDALGHILIASLISAPAAIVLASIMIPETGDLEDEINVNVPKTSENAMDALVMGTMSGIQLLLSIIAMIIVLFAMVSLLNQFLAFLPNINGSPITLELLFSFIFKPIVWLMGIPWSEASVASNLMSTKTVLNEFVSYQGLASLPPGSLSEKSQLIMTYAMCGFANFASLGLIVGSMGTLVPERRSEIVSLSFRSLVSGTLATCLTGAMVGIIL